MERTMKRSKVPTNTIKVNPNMVLHIHTHFIFAFDQELSDTSLVTDKRKSNDENIGANGNVNVNAVEPIPTPSFGFQCNQIANPFAPPPLPPQQQNRKHRMSPLTPVSDRKCIKKSLIPIDQIKNATKDEFIDIIGLCHGKNYIKNFVTKDGKNTKKCDIFLMDTTSKSTAVTIWDENADKSDDYIGKVVM